MKCLQCDKEIPYTNWYSQRKKFCGFECYDAYRKNKAKKTTRVCQQCSKEFIDRPIREKFNRGKFCSRDCWKKSIDKKVERVCKHCGNTFYSKISEINNGVGIYCSRKCSDLAKVTREKRTCLVCGTEFYTIQSWIKKGVGKYCSPACSHIAHTGKGNPQYQNGASYGKYCEKFNKNFKRRVRVFFGDRCVECGCTSEQNGALLAVHHVNYHKGTCCTEEVEPLFVPLCRSCHSTTGAKDVRAFYEDKYTRLIKEQYNGKCFYTKEEFIEIEKQRGLNQSSTSSPAISECPQP